MPPMWIPKFRYKFNINLPLNEFGIAPDSFLFISGFSQCSDQSKATYEAFVNHLFKENRTVFDKIFDEIKYLCKIATGTKEARELEKVKKAFEDTYRAETKNPTATGGVKYSLEQYSNAQKENWKNSKKIVIYENDAQLLQFIKDSINNKDAANKMYFGIISGELAERIKADTGLDFNGKNAVLRATNVRKIFLHDHGDVESEKLRGQIAVTETDFLAIKDIFGDPDTIKLEERGYNGKPAATFEKVIGDKKYTMFVADSGGSLDIFVQTMYIHKQKGSIANVANAKALTSTPKATVGTAPTTNVQQNIPGVKTFSLTTNERKEQQLAIILETNPMWDDYHTGIRSVEDIRTWEEVLELDDEREGQFVWGDFSREDAENALENNSVTVYSSYPISNGTFVSTSYTQAWEYAGGNKNAKVYSKKVPLEDVAWINGDEGQYAKIAEGSGNIGNTQYSLSSEDTSGTQYGDFYTPANAFLWAKRRDEKSWKKSKTVENNYVNCPNFIPYFFAKNAPVEKAVENVENSNATRIIPNSTILGHYIISYFLHKNGGNPVAVITCYGNQNTLRFTTVFC